MNQRYHTIIIGAGMSGLAAGIRLAYYEKPVLILERHTTIGGLNSFYRLRGRNYDVGLHAVTNYAPPGTKSGPLAKLLKQLRLRWEDFDLSPQVGSKVIFPGRTLSFDNDHAHFVDDVAQVFPAQADRFRKLVETINSFNELDLSQEPVSARLVLEQHLSDPVLIDMLFCPTMFYGSAIPRDMDFSQFVIMYKALFQQGFARPYDGVRRILKTLVRHYKELKGELRLRQDVTGISITNGRADGVFVRDGENTIKIEADNVLSSAGSWETMQLCPRGVGFEPVGSQAGSRCHGEISFCETIYSLDRQPSELGHNETIIFYNDSERFAYEPPADLCDVRSGIICSPNNFRYAEGAEPLEGTVRITALANPEKWMKLPAEDYVAQKQHWEQRMIASALSVMPDFRPAIVDSDMFTPKTIYRFTGHHLGAVYGAPHKWLTGETPYRNLFLCGTDQGFLGIIGSMLSGVTMANNHLLREG